MIKQEPKMDFKQAFGALFIALSFLMVLTIMHLLMINTTGDTHSVLVIVFTVTITLFQSMGYFVIGFVIIHLLKWLVWYVQTPKWMKKGGKNN